MMVNSTLTLINGVAKRYNETIHLLVEYGSTSM